MPDRILVVEDEPLLLDTVVAELEDRDFTVAGVSGGSEALDLLDRRPFDVLLTDIRLPGGIDGWTIATQARQRFPGIAIVYMSGYAPEPARAVPLGVLLQKPFAIDALVTALREALQSRAGDVPRCRNRGSGDELQQRRLAHAVTPHEPAVLGGESQVEAGEELATVRGRPADLGLSDGRHGASCDREGAPTPSRAG
jgi:CheY-like chemotaxis protein